MKRQILVSSLILLLGAVVTEAVDSAGFPFCDSSQDGLATYREGELVVRFSEAEPVFQPVEGPAIMGPVRRRTIREAMSDFIVSGATVEREYDKVVEGLVVVKLPEGVSTLSALVRFNSSANVLYAEPNYKYRLLAIPNDTYFYQLWGLDNYSDADIDAPEAWDIATGDSNIVVAVMDTGIDYSHPDLADNMWMNPAEASGWPGRIFMELT